MLILSKPDYSLGKHNIPTLPQEKIDYLNRPIIKGKNVKKVVKVLPPKMASSLRGFHGCSTSAFHRTNNFHVTQTPSGHEKKMYIVSVHFTKLAQLLT